MAQNLVTGDIVKAQVWSADSEQAAVGTYYYQVGTVTGGGATVDDFASDLDSAVAAPLKAIMTDVATYKGVTAQVVNPLPLLVRSANNSGTGIGTAGVSGAPRQSTGLLQLFTNLAGPGGRGRSYLPFVATADVTGIGVPIAGYVARGNTYGLALFNFNHVTGASSVPIVFGLWRRAGNIFTPIISVACAEKFATQKRRGSYGRPNSSPFG